MVCNLFLLTTAKLKEDFIYTNASPTRFYLIDFKITYNKPYVCAFIAGTCVEGL